MIGEHIYGSYFMQALIHILKNHTHDKSFLELMKEVVFNHRMGEDQV
jgi:hypothetical protein